MYVWMDLSIPIYASNTSNGQKTRYRHKESVTSNKSACMYVCVCVCLCVYVCATIVLGILLRAHCCSRPEYLELTAK
jgi:hypothetical protein